MGDKSILQGPFDILMDKALGEINFEEYNSSKEGLDELKKLWKY